MNMENMATPLIGKLIAWMQEAIRMLPNMLVALLCLVIFWFLAHVVGSLVRRMVLRLSIYRHVATLLAGLSRLVVIIAGILLALDTLNLDRALASMLTGIGIVGLALGLAAKNTGGDYLAGFIIHFTHPFRVGHLIQTGTFIGYVDSMELRATKILTQQGQRIVIPNHKIVENELTNYTITGDRRVDIKCGISYEADLNQAEELAIKAVESLETRKLDRNVDLYYEEFGESSIIFTLRFWTDPDQKAYLTGRSNAIKAINGTFRDNGITIPYPIRTLEFPDDGGNLLRNQLRRTEKWLPAPEGLKPEKDAGKADKAKSEKA